MPTYEYFISYLHILNENTSLSPVRKPLRLLIKTSKKQKKIIENGKINISNKNMLKTYLRVCDGH